jgi:hypothetical protein
MILRSEVLTAVIMKAAVFWDVMLCGYLYPYFFSMLSILLYPEHRGSMFL